MAGLLDINTDPMNMGLLSLGLRMLGTKEANLGRAISGAGMGALEDMQQAQARQQQSKQMEAAERMRKLQEQMTMLELERAKQQQAQQTKRGGYLDSVSQAAGPAMPMDMAGALAAGLSPQEASALMPKSRGFMSVAPGSVVLDEQTGKPVYTAPSAEPADTPDVRNYKYAQSQGYTGTFQQFKIELNKAGAPSNNVSFGPPVAGTDAAGNPVFFQPAKGGGTPAIIPGVKPPPRADSQPTGEERKAATLLQRLRGSQAQLEAAVAGSPEAAKPGTGAELVRKVAGDTPANLLTPAARQQVEAAQLDMLDAALTLGTGAAYTREQLEGYRRSFFPQIGDDPKTVKDKQARLQNVIRAAEVAAGRAEALLPPSGAQTPGMPSVEAIEAELARRRGGK